MELRPNVFAQQRQAITINAQVIQSLRLLQYSSDELQDFLRDQAERNPLIEVVGGPEAAPVVTATPQKATVAPTGPGGGRIDSGSPRREGGEAPNLEDYCAATLSLRDHLLTQVSLSLRCPAARMIAGEIVESLDEDGYFRRDPEELAAVMDVPPARVLEVLTQVQALEPTGVGARDLAECLRLQLRELGLATPPMLCLLDNLPLLAACDIPQLARLCKTDSHAVLAMQREIRRLDPRPGRQFGSDPMRPALPDVLVEYRPDGSFSVELNTALMPRVLVNRQYSATISTSARGEHEARFVSDCLRNANWLVHNLDQRAQTILRISTEIVKRQRAFFELGAARLLPLALKDIAGALGIHESTVCRASANKYMMTHRGMVSMKSFFANAIASSDGSEDVSANLVRQKIRSLIDAETVQSVLPDDAISAILHRDGIDIARRTVAKYREMLNIPTALTRKRQRAAAVLVAEAPGARPVMALAGASR